MSTSPGARPYSLRVPQRVSTHCRPAVPACTARSSETYQLSAVAFCLMTALATTKLVRWGRRQRSAHGMHVMGAHLGRERCSGMCSTASQRRVGGVRRSHPIVPSRLSCAGHVAGAERFHDGGDAWGHRLIQCRNLLFCRCAAGHLPRAGRLHSGGDAWGHRPAGVHAAAPGCVPLPYTTAGLGLLEYMLQHLGKAPWVA